MRQVDGDGGLTVHEERGDGGHGHGDASTTQQRQRALQQPQARPHRHLEQPTHQTTWTDSSAHVPKKPTAFKHDYLEVGEAVH